MTYTIFDKEYLRYDLWYQKYEKVAKIEVGCIRRLLRQARIVELPSSGITSLEIGVGTGFFASGVGIRFGVDPALNPIKIALKRGIEVARGMGERLPFRDESFHLVLIVVTLCFAEDALALLREARRVLKQGGYLITCIVPLNSYLAISYLRKSVYPKSFYRYAKFFSLKSVVEMLLKSGFLNVLSCSTVEGEMDVRAFHRGDPKVQYVTPLETLYKNGFHCILSKRGR